MSIPLLVLGLTGLLLTAAVWKTLQAGQTLQETSLTTAWGWSLAAESAWAISSLATFLRPDAVALLDQFWYWTACLTLCPWIAVLGARRPTSRVWSLFILVPLLAVLGWPALTVLFAGSPPPRLALQTPVLVSFGLVLVMGIGNYSGTRYGRAALLSGVAVCLILIPFAGRTAFPAEMALWLRAGGAVIFWIGIMEIFRQARRSTVARTPYDRLWFDFRDTFGIVWSIRIQERMNQTAGREQWTCRLGPEGFHSSDNSSDAAAGCQDRLEHALRWHLRRFVDPGWIDRRLGPEKKDAVSSDSS